MFNKKIALSNIDYLLKKQNKKIGELEQKAEVATGYVSRLKKEDNTSNPSIEFLTAAAEYLDIDLNSLISININELSEDDIYINKFINDIEKKTDSYQVHWRKQSIKELKKTSSTNDLRHPLFTNWCKYDEFHEPAYYYIKYESQSHPDDEFNVNGCFYYINIPGGRVFITSVGADSYKDEIQMHELYIIKNDMPTLLAYWKSDEENVFGDRIKRLYEKAKNSESHPKLSIDILDSIDAFMGDENKRKKIEEEEKKDAVAKLNDSDNLPFY